MLLYGITPEILLSDPAFCSGRLDLIYPLCQKNGVVVIQAHPFRHRDYIPTPDKRVPQELLDGYEIFNASNPPQDNEQAISAYSGSGKILVAGSDCHREHFGGIRAGICTKKLIGTEENLARVLKSGEFQLM